MHLKFSNTLFCRFTEICVVRNKPPAGGTCQLKSNSGTALISVFPQECLNWMDPEGVGIASYTYYYYLNGPNGPEKHMLVSTTQNNINLILPVGAFDLRVDIADHLGAITTVSLADGVIASMPTEAELEAFDASSIISHLSDVGDSATLGMILSALSSVQGNADWLSLDPAAIANLTEEELLARIADIGNLNSATLQSVLDTMDFATLDQLLLGSGILQSTLAGVFDGELGPLTIGLEARDAAMQLLQKLTNQVKEVKITDPNDLIPHLSNTMDAASAIMTSINAVIDKESDIGVSPNDLDMAPNLDYDTYIPGKGFVSTTNKQEQLEGNVIYTTKTESEKQIEQLFDYVDQTATAVYDKLVVGEVVATDSPNGAAILIAKLNEILLEPGLTLEGKSENAEKIIFPKCFCPSKYNTPNTICREEFRLTSSVWPCITHLYPDSSNVLSKKTKIIDINVDIRNERVRVLNESIPIIMRIPLLPIQLPAPLYVNAKKYKFWSLPIIYHWFNVTTFESSYAIQFTPFDAMPHNTILLIDHERMPTPSKHLKKMQISSLIKDSNGTYTYIVKKDENRNKTGRFFAGIGILKSNIFFSPTKKLQKKDFLKDKLPFDYSFRVILSGCYFFDKLDKTWKGHGLEIIESTPSAVTCASIHMTSFGVGFLPTPNAIDFEYIFANLGFSDNLSIYVVLAVVTTVIVLMLIWAHFMDGRDLIKRGVFPLPDNKVKEKYLYEITIKTGPDKDASCDSNKRFVVSGEYGDTEVRVLPSANSFLYRRFSTNQFVMAVPKPLGHINYLRIFHDNSGEPPLDSWQLEMVTFRDLQTNKKYIFDINDWLALDRGDGKIDKIFISLVGNEERTFSQRMYLRGNKSLNEDHLWMSVFLRQPHSRFGRKERVGVWAAFLYLSLLVNALWYQSEEDSSRNGYYDFGLLSLSLNLLYIGILVLVLVLPFTTILSCIFKRARPRNLKECRAISSIEEQRLRQLKAAGITNEEQLMKNSEVEVDIETQSQQKEASPIRCLPWWTRWLAWLLIFASVGASGFIVWAYGIMWGEVKTVKFLSTFIICLLISVLLAQFVKVLFNALTSAVCTKFDVSFEDADCDEELPTLKQNEEWAHLSTVDTRIRKKVYRVEGVNMDKKSVVHIRDRLMKEREMKAVVKTIFIYCLFLAVLYILVDGRTDYNAYLMKSHFTKTLIKKQHLKLDYSRLVSNKECLACEDTIINLLSTIPIIKFFLFGS